MVFQLMALYKHCRCLNSKGWIEQHHGNGGIPMTSDGIAENLLFDITGDLSTEKIIYIAIYLLSQYLEKVMEKNHAHTKKGNSFFPQHAHLHCVKIAFS